MNNKILVISDEKRKDSLNIEKNTDVIRLFEDEDILDAINKNPHITCILVNILIPKAETLNSIKYIKENNKNIAVFVLDSNVIFRTLLNSVDSGICVAYYEENQLNFMFANNKFYEINDINLEKEKKDIISLFKENVLEDDKEKINNFIYGKQPYQTVEYRIRGKDGKIKWIRARSNNNFDYKNESIYVICSFLDVTGERERETIYNKWQQNLLDRDDKTYSLFRLNLNKIEKCEIEHGKLFEFDVDDHEPKNFNELALYFSELFVAPEDRKAYLKFSKTSKLFAEFHRGNKSSYFEFRRLGKNEERLWTRLTIDLLEFPDSKDVAAYLMYEDINETKINEIKTKHQAEEDPLTGLLNRRTFEDKTNIFLNSPRKKTLHALLIIDIDRFKMVNDLLGHGVGDKVLIKVGEIIQSKLRDSDLVCRMGGDEYFIFLKYMPSIESIYNKAQDIYKSIVANINLEVLISCSIGIAVSPDDGTTFETLYNKADKALYVVKDSGKGQCAFYSSSYDGFYEKSKNGELIKKAEKKPLMLVIEDDKLNQTILSNIFKNEFEIRCLDNTQEALTYLGRYSKRVAVVLLDLLLPKMGGFELLNSFNKSKYLENIPVVVVGCAEDRDSIIKAIRLGASDYVTKPFDPEVLQKRLLAILKKYSKKD